ncbi:MAG: DUF7483 domain-containing protein [Bdellovibrio sp.]
MSKKPTRRQFIVNPKDPEHQELIHVLAALFQSPFRNLFPISRFLSNVSESAIELKESPSTFLRESKAFLEDCEKEGMDRRDFMRTLGYTATAAGPLFMWSQSAEASPMIALFGNSGNKAREKANSVSYVDDVFSTYTYTGSSAPQFIANGISFNNAKEVQFTKPGTYSWVVPSGVTSISVVCVGSGGATTVGSDVSGGGGALAYVNNVSVTPGETLTLRVSQSAPSSPTSTYLKRSATSLCEAGSGASTASGPGGTVIVGTGGSGGAGGNYCGGGGAGGYSGAGGAGGQFNGASGSAGAGGGGGGGGAYNGGSDGPPGGAGGGVGLFGQGANGASGNGGTGSGSPGGGGGGGGSGGTAGQNGGAFSTSSPAGIGGNYGGGAGGGNNGNLSISGGNGAIRIVWPGATRQFPSTSVDAASSGTNTDGGLVWIKNRSRAVDHGLYDTSRSALNGLQSNTSSSQSAFTSTLTGFYGNGFSLGSDTSNTVNNAGDSYVSWSFRKASKFFDVVTWTGTGATGDVSHAHSLGALPGMVIIKDTSAASNWYVWHKSTGDSNFLNLMTTGVAQVMTVSYAWNITSSAITTRENGTTAFSLNTVGHTYVAYLFAHDTSANGIIQCGTFTTNGGGNATIALGWEPQYILTKSVTSGAGGGDDSWWALDVMRGLGVDNQVSATASALFANSTLTESSYTTYNINSTGFGVASMGNTKQYIYLAIRRPNKSPTSGTQIYSAIARSGTGSATTISGVGFSPDWLISLSRNKAGNNDVYTFDRVRGAGSNLGSMPAFRFMLNQTAAEVTGETTQINGFTMDGVVSVGGGGSINVASESYVHYFFRRAAGVFDIVAYTGTGVDNTAYTHNLGVVPELLIIKNRTATSNTDWFVTTQFTATTITYCWLNKDWTAGTGGTYAAVNWLSSQPTSSQIKLQSSMNAGGITYIAYLFATKAGVSKVGSYTGDGTTNGSKVIACGFTTSARFIMIKRTDSTGDWFVWDTTRGITNGGNDPHLSFNTVNAEITTDDSIDSDTSGFKVKQNATTNINVNGATYIFLAIA